MTSHLTLDDLNLLRDKTDAEILRRFRAYDVLVWLLAEARWRAEEMRNVASFAEDRSTRWDAQTIRFPWED